MKHVVIIGAGGFGCEVLWLLQRLQTTGKELEIVGACDNDPGKNSGEWRGLPLLGCVGEAAVRVGGPLWFHVATGDNNVRQRLTNEAQALGWQALTLVDPSAIVAPDATLGPGCYVGAGAVVSCNASVGAGTIVNLQATVGHHARIGDFAHICPGARISGACHIGDQAVVGSNAVVVPEVAVGNKATIGAGAVAWRSIPDNGTTVRLSR